MRFAVRLLLIAVCSCGPREISSSLKDPSQDSYPHNPQESVTPGKLCEKGSTRSYPKEDIVYCNRDVKSDLKKEIIANYDRLFNYQIAKMPRSDFKIDHYIPLCMGGANSSDNLWPQHKTIYEKTDLIEQLLCEEMSGGKRLQVDAVKAIKDVKMDLTKAEKLLATLKENRK